MTDNIPRAAVQAVLSALLEDYREHGNDEGYAALEEALIDISAIRSRPPSPEMALLDENNALRAALAASGADCPFCGLPASDLAKCQSGFPGCARADDLMLAPFPVEGEGLDMRPDGSGLDDGVPLPRAVVNYWRDPIMKRLHDAGCSLRAIAEGFGISHEGVRAAIRRSALSQTPGGEVRIDGA